MRLDDIVMIRRRRPFLIALAAAAAGLFAPVLGAPAAQAQQRDKPRAVLELFTSQGCSSCPAADALFVTLAKDPSLLVLTLPVDYWDYLGWRDTLAHAAFSQRQRSYAKTRGDGQIYTPQAIVDGVAHTVGSDRAAIEQLMRQRGEPALPLDVTLAQVGDAVRIVVSGNASAASGSIWILPTAGLRSVSVQRGENRGRDIVYANVVRSLTRVGSWRGQPVTVDLPASLTRTDDSDGFVVLVHADDGKVGRVIGAARGPAP
jgi:hypothetical protein